jgi:hypothetical protein
MTIRPLLLLGLGLVLACPERNRLTGPTTGIGVGPEITITDPAQDVTMTAGSAIFVKGVAFTTITAQSAGGVPRATFSIPLDLVGASGDTVSITIYAANLEHVRGDPVTRRIRLR